MIEWRNIEGYESLYQISSDGVVKSLDRFVNNNGGYELREGRLLKTCENRGYIQVALCRDGKPKTHKVHHLVAKAFPEICGEWFDGCEIDHIDGMRNNNKATNLKVCTKSENMRNPITISKLSKVKKKPIIQYTPNGEFIREWDCALTASRELGIARSVILNSIKGCNTRKYKWAFKDNKICA